jgi:hypothetical protein
MKYIVEMGSGPMIYIPSFVKIGAGIEKLIHRPHGDLINLLSFLQNKESGLIKISVPYTGSITRYFHQ